MSIFIVYKRGRKLSYKWSKKYKNCIKCGTTKVKYKGNGYCKKCYDKLYEKIHKEKCSICKRKRPISTKKDGKIICKSCYKKFFYKIKKRRCSICNKIGRIDKIDNDKLICTNCYEKYYLKPKFDVCSICRKLRPRVVFKDEKSICGVCYRKYIYVRPKRICDKCRELGYIDTVIKGRKICHSCYKKINRERYLALNHIRYAKIKGTDGKISGADFKNIIRRDKVCVYCGNKNNLTLDHIIPVAKGGKSNFNNYVVACKRCNTSKGKKDIFEWCEQNNLEVPPFIINLLNKG